MAFLDDKKWLLSFIRNQFIVSDDTGICESVLASGLEPEDIVSSFGTHSACSPLSTHEDDGPTTRKPHRSHSPDITIDQDSRSIRRRSNTAVRLEKVRKERDDKGRVQITRWTSDKVSGKSSNDAEEEFLSFPVPARSAEVKRKSALTSDLENGERITPHIQQQVLLKQYTKFDGRGLPKTAPVDRFKIFMHLPEFDKESTKPSIVVTIVADARFSDLVGLICLQWTESNPEVRLRHPPNKYRLRMVEENGELDQDFPDMQVETTQLVHKFSNSPWAFMETNSLEDATAADVIKVNFVEGSFTKITVEPEEALQSVLDKVLRKRKLRPSVRGFEYVLEKANEPGVPVDLSQNVGNIRCKEFYLVRSNSKNPAVLSRDDYSIV